MFFLAKMPSVSRARSPVVFGPWRLCERFLISPVGRFGALDLATRDCGLTANAGGCLVRETFGFATTVFFKCIVEPAGRRDRRRCKNCAELTVFPPATRVSSTRAAPPTEGNKAPREVREVKRRKLSDEKTQHLGGAHAAGVSTKQPLPSCAQRTGVFLYRQTPNRAVALRAQATPSFPSRREGRCSHARAELTAHIPVHGVPGGIRTVFPFQHRPCPGEPDAAGPSAKCRSAAAAGVLSRPARGGGCRGHLAPASSPLPRGSVPTTFP
jgi:hypothetical protein